MKTIRKFLGQADPRGLAAVVALAAVSIGCAIERLSLGLIVPGSFVLAALCWSHIRGDDNA